MSADNSDLLSSAKTVDLERTVKLEGEDASEQAPSEPNGSLENANTVNLSAEVATRKSSTRKAASVSRPLSGPTGSTRSGSVSRSFDITDQPKESAAKRRARKESEANVDARRKKFKKERRARLVRRSIIALVVIILVVAIGGFSILRWGGPDDKTAIQGTWRVDGTNTNITITDKTIELTDGIAYDYVMDPESKTLTFKFGELSGGGRYRFSINRQQLSVSDGEYDWLSTLLEDIPWTIEAVGNSLIGETKSPSLGDGSQTFSRVG